MADMKLLTVFLIFLVVNSSAKQANYGLKMQDESSNFDPINQCQNSCSGSPACLKECRNLYGQPSQTAKLIGISIGVLSLLAILIVTLIVACIFPCLCCPCHPYQKCKQIQNKILDQNITEENYQSQKNGIMNFLNVTESEGTFSFVHEGRMISSRSQAKIVKQYKLKTKIRVWGCDEGLGEWIAHGYILMKKKGIGMWMYKIYQDKKNAAPIGKCTELIFKSTRFEEGKELKGKWQLASEENENETQAAVSKSRGSWQIKMKQNYELLNSVQSGILSNSQSAVPL